MSNHQLFIKKLVMEITWAPVLEIMAQLRKYNTDHQPHCTLSDPTQAH